MLRENSLLPRKKPYKSRKGLYFIGDPFFRFWFRYVYPNTSFLEEGDIDHVWNKKIKPDLDSFTGFAFEEICAAKLKELNRNNELPFKAERIGRWWDKETEIDVVAYDKNGNYMFVECKWRGKKLGTKILNDLINKSKKFANAKNLYFGFFSKSGFTDELKKLSEQSQNIYLFDY